MKKTLAVLLALVLALGAAAVAESATSELQNLYAEAELLMAQGDYAGAASKFEGIGTYSDASQMAMYCKAISAAETLGMYDIAVMTFGQLGDFRDSKQMVTYYTARGYEAKADAVDAETAADGGLRSAIDDYDNAGASYAELALFKDCLTRYQNCMTKRGVLDAELAKREADKLEADYQAAVALQESGDYQKAIDAFKKLNGYSDSDARIVVCEAAIDEAAYQAALALEQGGEYQKAIEAYEKLNGYSDSDARIAACEEAINEAAYQAALALEQGGEYQKAIEAYEKLGDYKDSKDRITENAYLSAVRLQEKGDYDAAMKAFEALEGYKDSITRRDECEAIYGLYWTYNNILNQQSTKFYPFISVQTLADNFRKLDNIGLHEIVNDKYWIVRRYGYTSSIFVHMRGDGVGFYFADLQGSAGHVTIKDIPEHFKREKEYSIEGNHFRFNFFSLSKTIESYEALKIADGFYIFHTGIVNGEYTDRDKIVMVIESDAKGTPLYKMDYDPVKLKREEAEEAEKIAAQPPEPTPNPTEEFTDKDTIKAVQAALNDAGYNCGTPDGAAGKKTKAAISAYQKDHGLTETGTATRELLAALGIQN